MSAYLDAIRKSGDSAGVGVHVHPGNARHSHRCLRDRNVMLVDKPEVSNMPLPKKLLELGASGLSAAKAVNNAGYDRLVNLNIGKTRDVLVSYAAKPGRNSTSRRQSSLRSSPVTSVASTGKVAVPTSTMIRGCFLRL
jgi:hypothetical protein